MPIRAVPSDFIGFARRKALNSMGLKGLGGEGGIRTPDSLATMSDFESGAFNRALPPLRLLTTLLSMCFCLCYLRELAPDFPVADLVPIRLPSGTRRSTAEAWCSGARFAYRMAI
jgi:hypothetical protein